MAILSPPPTKPSSNRVVLEGEEKIEYAKPGTWLRGVSYRKIGLTTTAVTNYLISGISLVHFFKRIHPPFDQYIILPDPEQPSAQLSLRPITCSKTQSAMSRWYRTVHKSNLIVSYDKQALASF